LVVHSKHRALALRLRINADAHRIQEITRPVKIGFGSVALNAGQDNWFLGIGCEIELIRCLLKRVGSMRNDDASYFRAGECTIDVAGQSDPPRWIHVVGRHVRNIIDLDLGVSGTVATRSSPEMAGIGAFFTGSIFIAIVPLVAISGQTGRLF
jgi:hypothetical protein